MCSALGVPALTWASLVDQTGDYGLTKVECTRVDFGPGSGNPLSLVRALVRIAKLFLEP